MLCLFTLILKVVVDVVVVDVVVAVVTLIENYKKRVLLQFNFRFQCAYRIIIYHLKNYYY